MNKIQIEKFLDGTLDYTQIKGRDNKPISDEIVIQIKNNVKDFNRILKDLKACQDFNIIGEHINSLYQIRETLMKLISEV